MKYYKLMFDYKNSEGNVVCNSDEMYGIDRYELEQGRYFDKWDNRFTFFYDPNQGDKWTDYLSTDLGWFVISTKFKETLDRIGVTNIQYIPVRIKNVVDDSLVERYFVANICSLIDALDLENSDYSVFELDENEKVLSVRKYALKRNAIKGLHVFRVEKSQMAIFVSEKVKEEVERNKITGCDFLEVKIV
jgi:hypothetical protein